MNYSEKLEELLIKIEALGNTFMAENIRKAIQEAKRHEEKS